MSVEMRRRDYESELWKMAQSVVGRRATDDSNGNEVAFKWNVASSA